MPRDSGTGQYSKPIPNAIPNTTIASAPYNLNVDDVVIDLNSPRPIVAGGTGASNATDAMVNLGGEKAGQVVTNYDSHPFVSGSFFSNGGATNEPVAGHLFAGICYFHSSNYITIEARDESDTVAPGRKYVRQKLAGSWSVWFSEGRNIVGANEGISGANADMFFGLNGTSPTSAFIINTKADVTGTSIFTALKASGDVRITGSVVAGIGGVGGNYFFGNTGTKKLVYEGTNFVFSGGPLMVDNVTTWIGTGGATGTLQFGNTGTKNLVYNGSNFVFAGAPLSVNSILVTQSALVSGGPFAVNIGYTSPYGIAMRPSTDTAATPLVFVNAASVIIGSISTSAVGTSFNTSSDGTLKEDLQPAGITASQILNDTEIYNFRWKSSGERSYGVIAQQAAPIYPGPFLHDEEIDRWFVDYSKYVPILIQEAKTLKTRISSLESRLAVLEVLAAKIEAL